MFRVDTEVVLLDVVVRDKKGRSVRDLRPDEIEVYEDGVRQQVGNFRFLDSRAIGEALEDAQATAPSGAPAPAAAPPPKPGESRHLNLVTLLFDQLGPSGRGTARKAALSFLELENRPDVYVSVFQIGESLRLLQQFTTDRDVVGHAVEYATGQLDTQYTRATDRLAQTAARANALRDQLESVTSAGTGLGASTAAAQLGQEVDMANMAVNALRLTDTLQREQQGHSSLFSILSLAKQQQPLAGRKTILFFSEGLQAPPTLDHVLLAAISEANRANVSVYAVDARGLSTVSDTAAARATLDEAVATSMRQQMLRGFRLFTREEMLISDTAESALRMDTIGTLEQLAESTGGLLISHTNDVRAGIARAVGDLRGYYEVAYSPANLEFDGRFRKIALKVTRPGVTVQTRSGYFAMPPGEGTATFSYEVQLLKALRSPDPPHDLPVRTRALPLRPGGGRTALHGGPGAAARRDPVREGPGPLLRARPLLVPGRAADALGCRRREVQPGRAGLAAAQAPRRPEAGKRRVHALLHPARGALPARDRGDGPAVGAHERRPEPSERAPGPLVVRAEQPRGREARRARAEGRPRLRRPVPGRRGPHRPLGHGGGGGPDPGESASSSWRTCPRDRRRPRRSRSSSSTTPRWWARRSPTCRLPTPRAGSPTS